MHSFLTTPKIRVFLATDAASEGKNLQHGVHHLVHLDVPWNPNRYVQRNGRIDRYGQTETPHIWALVAADRKGNEGRPEYRALEIVIEKLQRIAKESGSVGRVLPNFTSGKVREVLAGNVADVEGQVDRLMDDEDAQRANEDLTRLTLRNREELRGRRPLRERARHHRRLPRAPRATAADDVPRVGRRRGAHSTSATTSSV